jgi:hypothetical protein
MPIVPTDLYRRLPPKVRALFADREFFRKLRQPSPRLEILFWLVIAALIVGMRLWIVAHLPAYLWTRDSKAYFLPAIGWLETGEWISSPRRGPIYSLFMGVILKMGGNLVSVVNAQTALGALTALATVGAARAWFGRAAFWPLAVCSLFYATYALPMHYERFIRSETLMTLFTTAAFGAWFFVLRSHSARGRFGWIGLAGLAGGLMHLLRQVFPLYPALVVVLLGWQLRRQPALACALIVSFLVMFALPTAASKLYDRLSGTGKPRDPEPGQMFYGRVAQWTYLDGGMAPDIKARIRAQVEDYIRVGKKARSYDFNIPVKRTVVPTIRNILVNERGQTPRQVDAFCWKLGLEAASREPGRFALQVAQDCHSLSLVTLMHTETFKPSVLLKALTDGKVDYDDLNGAGRPFFAHAFDIQHNEAVVREAVKRKTMRNFVKFANIGWKRWPLSPSFWTSLLLPVLWYFSRNGDRLYWLSAMGWWYPYLMLLAVLARPVDRYLMPTFPVMFWTIAAALALGWRSGLAWLERRGALDAEASKAAAAP